jgi:hypothetical protein
MECIFFMFLDHTQQCSTVGRTPLDERSARRRDLYLTTHNTHNRQISMPLVGVKPTISVGERPQAAHLLIARSEESYRLCCVVVCDLETSRKCTPYIYDISTLRVKPTETPTNYECRDFDVFVVGFLYHVVLLIGDNNYSVSSFVPFCSFLF